MHTMLATLIDRLDNRALSRAAVIRWGSPIPCFGNMSTASTATLGLNPSNREFLDHAGNELEGASRRFHTLRSLRLESWAEVDARHLSMILESCRSYFLRSPYDAWFRKLNQVLLGAGVTYYGDAAQACHLDLVPYATSRKWTELSSRQRSSLLGVAADTLGHLLRESPVRVLVLNGESVVRLFEEVGGTRLERQPMDSWSLPRQSRGDVMGYAYRGAVGAFAGIELRKRLLVLGFNHNLQSSFGITGEVTRAIGDWISEAARESNQ